MPSFTFTSPQGKSYTVSGPDGATKEQAFQILQQQIGNPSAVTGSTPANAPAEKSWGDVATQAITNAPSSVGHLVGGIYQAVKHPLDTAKGVIDIGAGELQKVLPSGLVNSVNAALPSGAQAAEDARNKAGAVNQFYANRYGSVEGIKNALATDPAGVAADAATVLTAGGGIASKIPGLAKAGNALVTAGKAIDPINAMVNAGAKMAPMVGRAAANAIGGLGTHTGGESIKAATRAGYEGGQKAAEFADNMRGNVPMESVLDNAKAALNNMRLQKSAEYRAGMSGVSADKTVLDFAPIDQALNDAMQVSTFKGKSINRSAADIQKKISDVVSEWRAENPAEFHTAEGLDALKRTIGDIRDSAEYGTPSRVVADRVYNAVKDQIVKQAPKYANVMKDYEKASSLVNEIERSLSLGKKSAADTAMRKLQSLTRNNVNTNYGNRLDLARELEQAGAPNLLSNLSGQALNSWSPRGLGNLVAGGAAAGGVMTANPSALGIIAAQSPRAMGEAAFATGRAAAGVKASADAVNALALRLGVSPSIAANYLYQANQVNQQQK